MLCALHQTYDCFNFYYNFFDLYSFVPTAVATIISNKPHAVPTATNLNGKKPKD